MAHAVKPPLILRGASDWAAATRLARVTAQAIRQFLQAQQFARPKPERDGQDDDEQLPRHRQKSSAHAQPDELEAEKNGAGAERRAEENLQAEG